MVVFACYAGANIEKKKSLKDTCNNLNAHSQDTDAIAGADKSKWELLDSVRQVRVLIKAFSELLAYHTHTQNAPRPLPGLPPRLICILVNTLIASH